MSNPSRPAFSFQAAIGRLAAENTRLQEVVDAAIEIKLPRHGAFPYAQKRGDQWVIFDEENNQIRGEAEPDIFAALEALKRR